MTHTSEDFYKRELVTTSDGTSSIFLPQLNEHYHSHHGAVQESQHVFMKMGWEHVFPNKEHVAILEIGFGTGLNAWLVMLDVKWNHRPAVHYTSLELYPVELELARQLKYASAQEANDFMLLHETDWNVSVVLHDRFTVEKRSTSVHDFIAQRNYDLIFFDAFSPRVQPEMWTKDVFDRVFQALNPGGTLVTYCSKGDVRRNMIAAGFSVNKVPGPPGKREMLRATKLGSII